MSDDLNWLSAREMVRRFADRSLSPVDVLEATLAFSGGSPFAITGVPIAQDAAVLDLGLDFNLTRNAVLGITYGGQFGSSLVDQTVRANFSARF